MKWKRILKRGALVILVVPFAWFQFAYWTSTNDCQRSKPPGGEHMAVAQVALHSEGTVDLRRDLLGVVCALRFHLPHFPALQQHRERLHLRFANGFVRTGRESLALV